VKAAKKAARAEAKAEKKAGKEAEPGESRPDEGASATDDASPVD
jgi:hypothetical protein